MTDKLNLILKDWTVNEKNKADEILSKLLYLIKNSNNKLLIKNAIAKTNLLVYQLQIIYGIGMEELDIEKRKILTI